MKTLLKSLMVADELGRARKGKNRFSAFMTCLVLLFLMLALVTTSRAQPVGTTYVVPRPVTLWSGTLTNGQSITNIFVTTNLLNAVGYHHVKLWASVGPANVASNSMLAQSNIVLSIDYGPGTANGYTNVVYGTNVVYTSNQPFTWQLPNAGTNSTALYYTNLDAIQFDGVFTLKGTKLTSSTTNNQGVLLQFDATLTP